MIYVGLDHCDDPSIDLPDAEWEAAEAARFKIEERLGAICRDAEERSVSICEVCGAPGRVRCESGWAKARCDEHAPSAEH